MGGTFSLSVDGHNNDTHLIVLLWELNELILVKCLGQRLEHNSKHHRSVSKSLSDNMNLFITFEFGDDCYNAGGVSDSCWWPIHWLLQCQQVVWWNLANLELVHRLSMTKWKVAKSWVFGNIWNNILFWTVLFMKAVSHFTD